MPDYVHIAFTAGTGGATNYHETRDLEVDSAAVPEPSTLVVWLSLGGLGVVFGCWRRRKSP